MRPSSAGSASATGRCLDRRGTPTSWRQACRAAIVPMPWTTWSWCCSRTARWTTSWGTCTARRMARPSRASSARTCTTRSRSGRSTRRRSQRSGRVYVATDMDAPNPDSGEEYYHTNTQLFNTLGRAQPIQDRGRDRRAVERAAGGCRCRPWTGSSPTTSVTSPASGSPADVRGVRADHDRVHPRAGAGAQRTGPRFRGVRPLVLRGAVTDVHEPVVLDRGHVHAAPRGDRQHAGRRTGSRTTPQRRSSTGWNHTGKTWKVYVSDRTLSLHRGDPLAAAQGPVRDALRAVRASSRRMPPRATCPTSR